MTLRNLAKAAVHVWLFPASLMLAQDDTTQTQKLHRPLVGFRAIYFPFRFFNLSTVQTTTTSPAASYTYTAKSDSAKYIVGPTVEYRWTAHVSLGLELHFHHANYSQTATVLNGVPPPTTFDLRTKTTITQDSKINYWEIPLLAHYYGVVPHGRLSRTYVSGGVQYRHVGRIRTANSYQYPDNTSDYNETPPPASVTNQFGALVGVGMRFLDDYNIKLSPEIRFIRWFGTTFQGPAFRSAQNQVEGTIGVSV